MTLAEERIREAEQRQKNNIPLTRPFKEEDL